MASNTACVSCHTPGHLTLPTDDQTAVSDTLAIDIYVDSSGSIRGFLKDAKNATDSIPNRLDDFLNKCETTLKPAWNDARLAYWSFGDGEPRRIDSLRPLLDTPERFAGAKQTLIDTAILHTPPELKKNKLPELKIVVTDLYQNGNQMEKPAEALIANYLKDDATSVGILAVRNPFHGQVEDLPGMSGTDSLTGAADSMPFYIVVAGRTADVRHCLDKLVHMMELRSALEHHRALELVFARRLEAKPAGAGSAVTVLGKGYTLIAEDYSQRRAPNPIPFIALRKETVKLALPSEFDVAREFQIAKPDRFKASVVSFDAKGEGKADDTAAGALEFQPGRWNEAIVTRSRLVKCRTYLIRFDLLGSPTAALEPNALGDWNIERAAAVNIAKRTHKFSEQDGEYPGKTPDLSKFLKTLQDQMFAAPVHFASYYVYIQAK